MHVGIGRSPGTVDLPIARDSFGLPYVPGSAIKGSIKSACLRFYASECSRFSERSSECKCYWLYGWDLRILPSNSPPEEVFSSPVSLSDATLLLIPSQSSEGGYVYVTSPLAIERFNDVLKVSSLKHGGLSEIDVSEIEGGGTGYFNNIRAEYVGTIDPNKFQILLNNGTSLSKLLLKDKRVYVLKDDDFVNVVEAGIVRQTRIRLDFKKKVVEKGALWSEEYVPEGAVFVHIGIFTPLATSNGPSNLKQGADNVCKCHEEVLKNHNYVIDIGGKETIGKGLVKVVI